MCDGRGSTDTSAPVSTKYACRVCRSEIDKRLICMFLLQVLLEKDSRDIFVADEVGESFEVGCYFDFVELKSQGGLQFRACVP